MKCYIPKHSGFCFGVSLAVKAAYENLDNLTFMYGEVVHNPIVVSDLQEKGMVLINNLEEIPDFMNAKVLIRAHGVSENTIQEIKNRHISIIDKTCPKVKKVHDIVMEASNRGLDVIVVGTPNHPEIIGTMGWSKTNTILLHNIEDAKRIIPNTIFPKQGVCMVAQTTYNKKKYEEIYNYCSTIIPNIEYHETICDATTNRQEEIREFAKIADCFIVIGGKTSSNVTKLYEIASEYCNNIQHVESASEIDLSRLKNVESLVISSGASTPENSILEVVEVIKSFCKDNDIKFELIKIR